MNIFIQKGYIKLTLMTKGFYIVKDYCFKNKCCTFELPIQNPAQKKRTFQQKY